MRDGGREGERKRFHLGVHAPDGLLRLGMGEAKPRSQEFQPGLSRGYRRLSPWAIFQCFPRCMSREHIQRKQVRQMTQIGTRVIFTGPKDDRVVEIPNTEARLFAQQENTSLTVRFKEYTSAYLKPQHPQ